MFELDTEDFSQFKDITNSLTGTNAHKFVNISSLHYDQMDVVTFHQMKIEKFLCEVNKLILSYPSFIHLFSHLITARINQAEKGV